MPIRIKPWDDVAAEAKRQGFKDADIEQIRKLWNADNERLAKGTQDAQTVTRPPPSVPGSPRVAGNAPAPKVETPAADQGGIVSTLKDVGTGAMKATGEAADWYERQAV